MMGLYIHIPFCKSKCAYCDFFSTDNFTISLLEQYLQAVLIELKLHLQSIDDPIIQTVYIGGGTPSIIPSTTMNAFLSSLFKLINPSKLVEVTIEANPESCSEELFEIWKDYPIHRISLGIQSTHDHLLKKINRITRYNDIKTLFSILPEYPFNYSADLLYGLPDQNFKSIREDLAHLMSIQLNHISLYELTIYQGTPLFDWIKKKSFPYPEDKDAWVLKTLPRIIDLLNYYGFQRYEISNYAKKGYQCLHNLNYWKGGHYIGCGASASGYYNQFRYTNVTNIHRYIKRSKENGFSFAVKETLHQRQREIEYIMLRLRLTEGFSLMDFKQEFGDASLTRLLNRAAVLFQNELLINNHDQLYCSDRGLYLVDSIVEMLTD